MNSELRIRTPEGIVFAYPLAGPVTRCLACGADMLTVGFAASLMGKLLSFFDLIAADFTQALSLIAYFVLSIAYGVVMEWSCRGQTIGKRLLRLRVMDASGLRLHFHQVLMRNLLRFVDMLPAFYLIGGLVCLLSPRAQRLGDLAAGTIVIHHPRHTEPDLDQLLAGKFNSLRDYPHLGARLRQRVTPEGAGLVLQALLRRDEFEAAARVALFADLAAHFKQLASFPEEVLETMPDEQFIRNIVDILFRSNRQPASQPASALVRSEQKPIGAS